jgi:hypothetical protein
LATNAAADALAAAAAAADGSTVATGAEDAAGALGVALGVALAPLLGLSQAQSARGTTTHKARCTFMAGETSGFGEAE